MCNWYIIICQFWLFKFHSVLFLSLPLLKVNWVGRLKRNLVEFFSFVYWDGLSFSYHGFVCLLNSTLSGFRHSFLSFVDFILLPCPFLFVHFSVAIIDPFSLFDVSYGKHWMSFLDFTFFMFCLNQQKTSLHILLFPGVHLSFCRVNDLFVLISDVFPLHIFHCISNLFESSLSTYQFL